MAVPEAADYFHAFKFSDNAFEQFGGLIGRRVVDNNQLKIFEGLGGDAIESSRKKPSSIIRADNYRDYRFHFD